MQVFHINIKESVLELVTDVTDPWACYILYQNNSIARLGKTDPNGILYIGKADNLYKRVTSLQKSVLSNCGNDTRPKIRGHQSLSKKVFRIQRFLDTNKMTIKIVVLPSYESIMYTESYLLEEYVRQFGELPPLNGQYGKYGFNEAKNYLEINHIQLDNLFNV